MPNIKSAKKRVKVNAVKRMQNKIQKSQMKTELKSLTAKISETKDAKLLSEAYKTLDQAAGGMQDPPDERPSDGMDGPERDPESAD